MKIMFLAEKINQESKADEEKNVSDIIEALNNDILILDNDYNHKIHEWLLHIDTQNYSHPKNYCGNFSGIHVNCINDSLIENDVSIIIDYFLLENNIETDNDEIQKAENIIYNPSIITNIKPRETVKKCLKFVDYSSTSSDSEKSTNGVDNKGKNYPVLEDNWECSTGYSGEESLKSSTSSQREYIRGNKRKRKERKIEINKRNRNSGEEYVNYKNKKIEKKIVLANPCAAKKCNNKCNAFSDDDRYQIFKLFWSLKAVEEKRGFINGCVNVVPVQRKRTLKEHSRRGLTYQYFFVKDGIQLRVCLQFFIATLNISHKLVRSSIKGKVEENKDNRGRHEPRHKATTIQLDDFRRFIRALPAVPSHYCRSSSNKLYLPAEVKSIANLYRSYVNHVQEEGKIPLCLSSFRK